MSVYIALALGGVLGVYARYGLTQMITRVWGPSFPTATLLVNVLGTFLLAFLFIATMDRLSLSPALRTGILTGGLGAFTTFSTFMMEALVLIENGEMPKALLYLGLSIALGISAAFAGVYLARTL